MKVRLLVLFGALALGVSVAATPAAAETSGAVGQPAVGALATPGQWSGANQWYGGDCGCGPGGYSGGMPGGWPGYSFGFHGPWWAGLPLGAISASTGYTWPFAPWYWTPQWWTAAALGNLR